MVAICCRYSYWLVQLLSNPLEAWFASVALWSPEQQLQHHLGCQKFTFSGPTPVLLNQKFQRWALAIRVLTSPLGGSGAHWSWRSTAYISATQNVICTGHLGACERGRILDPSSDQLNQNLHFYKTLRLCTCKMKLEKPWLAALIYVGCTLEPPVVLK